MKSIYTSKDKINPKRGNSRKWADVKTSMNNNNQLLG